MRLTGPIAIALAATYACGTWLAGVSVLVLILIWRLLRGAEGPSVLSMALTFQWVQVTVGLFYTALGGDPLPAILDTDYRTMVLIGLGCVTALTVGLWLGLRVMRPDPDEPEEPRPDTAFTWRTLIIVYLASIAVTATIQQLAWEYPALTQAILALSFSRLAVLFLMLRRLSAPVYEWKWIAALICTEIALGLTGFFAGFREPVILAAIATLEVFDRRNPRHWSAAAALAVVLAITSVVWMGVRTEYRQDFESDVFAESRAVRLERIRALAGGWFQQDSEEIRRTVSSLIDRVWAIYYPALAIARVPTTLPHTDGEILTGALLHLVTPRVLFPDKAELPSDSEMVRKYSGVWVASVDENTSIAFGYAAESYVDFGLPWMFAPVFVFGILMGIAYAWFMRTIRHRELAIALSCVMFWLGLYLFERSWIKTLGLNVTMMVYLGGLCFLVDRYLLGRAAKIAVQEGPLTAPPGSRTTA